MHSSCTSNADFTQWAMRHTTTSSRSWSHGSGFQSSARRFNTDRSTCEVWALLPALHKLHVDDELAAFAEGYFLFHPMDGRVGSCLSLSLCYDTFTLNLPGQKPCRLMRLLPTPSNPTESVAAMMRATTFMTACPALRVSVWVSFGPDEPMRSGEIAFACSVKAIREVPVVDSDGVEVDETFDCLYIQWHHAHLVSDALKESRSSLDVEADPVSAIAQGSSSICGGSGWRFPCNSYHLHVHADVVFLSDDAGFVPVSMVVGIADVVPVIDADSDHVLPESPVGWTDENEMHEHFRPPLLRAYLRV
jgi:hypothetical protein